MASDMVPWKQATSLVVVSIHTILSEWQQSRRISKKRLELLNIELKKELYKAEAHAIGEIARVNFEEIQKTVKLMTDSSTDKYTRELMVGQLKTLSESLERNMILFQGERSSNGGFSV